MIIPLNHTRINKITYTRLLVIIGIYHTSEIEEEPVIEALQDGFVVVPLEHGPFLEIRWACDSFGVWALEEENPQNEIKYRDELNWLYHSMKNAE